MIEAPHKCLFCLSCDGPFTATEHPIPESLGNDDLTLDPGFVCDPCNQYFGSKVEGPAVNSPPFGIERVACDIKTKKGKHPKFERYPPVSLFPTSFLDRVIIVASKDYWSWIEKTACLVPPRAPRDDLQTSRLLIKMGLELLLLGDGPNPYESRFNASRSFARFALPGSAWQISCGLYPRKQDLLIAEREDEIGSIITHQIYQYSIGIMQSGDVIFCFVYRTHVFGVNLIQPSIQEYVEGFNPLNEFRLEKIQVVVR